MLETLTARLARIVKQVRGEARLTEANIQEMLREVRIALLEADVALPVVKHFIDTVRAKALGAEVVGSLTPGQALVGVVHRELTALMGEANVPLNLATQPPAVILMAGLQGSGKTTTSGKLARFLVAQRKKVALVSCDVYRPAAIEQLKTVATQAGAQFIPSAIGETPADIARRALEFARTHYVDVLIVDTAGRLAIDEEMMREIAELHALLQPIETLFIVDAMQGQDAVNVARAFNERLPLTGVILTKLDGDARGGAALSVRPVTGRPIMFASTGEKLEDFEVFHPDRMASRILDMGDLLTLIEQAEKAFDRDQAEQMARKLVSEDEFTFDDFMAQLAAVKQMGSLKKMLGMMPGMAGIREQLDNLDEREFDRTEAMVHSMTPQERSHPKLINGSRRARIARGSGRSVSDVNDLLERLATAQKMMKQLRRGGGIPGMPGMPGMPGLSGKGGPGRKAKGGKGKQRAGSRSGNPAKRAEQERAAAQRSQQGVDRAIGSAFGMDDRDAGSAPEVDPASVSLPPGFEKFLGS
jgi:signal recognition particle subunit SRP54